MAVFVFVRLKYN